MENEEHKIDMETHNLLDKKPKHEENTATKSIKNFRSAVNEGKIDIVQKIIKTEDETLNKNKSTPYYSSFLHKEIETLAFRKKYRDMNLIIQAGYNVYKETQHYSNLLFFSAAYLGRECLEECLEQTNNIHQVYGGDSVLHFLIKYANLKKNEFVDCSIFLIKKGFNINKLDYRKEPVIVTLLYKHNKLNKGKDNRMLNNINIVISHVIRSNRVNLDHVVTIKNTPTPIREYINSNQLFDTIITNSSNYEISELNKWFNYIITENESDFNKPKNIKSIANQDDGENTLLQLATIKNFKSIVKKLLKNNADPNKTMRNKDTPLEIAAICNFEEIFLLILNCERLRIDKNLYELFLNSRGCNMKLKYFDLLLTSKNMITNVKSKSGNSPLYYACLFSNVKGIHNLLLKKASLLEINDKNGTPLDQMSSETFSKLLDKFIYFDKYIDADSIKFEIKFVFDFLIEDQKDQINEIDVITQISKYSHLQDSLCHPLLYIFLNLKWEHLKLKRLFYILCALQFIIYLIIFGLVWKIEKNLTCNVISVILLAALAGTFIYTIRFHPKYGKYSVMLENSIKKFFCLNIFFLMPLSVFVTGFHSLFDNSKHHLGYSIINVMTFMLGNIEVKDVGSDGDIILYGLISYIFMFLFITIAVLVIMNFWTGVVVSDIEKINKKSSIIALQNTVMFLKIINYLLPKKWNYNLFTKNSQNTNLNRQCGPVYYVQYFKNKYSKEFKINNVEFSIDLPNSTKNYITDLCKNLEKNENENNNMLMKKISEIEKKLDEFMSRN